MKSIALCLLGIFVSVTKGYYCPYIKPHILKYHDKNCPAVALDASRHQESSPSSTHKITNLGIQDKEAHVCVLHRSLKKLTGRGIFDRMGLDDENAVKEVLTNDRFVLISHGTEEDPIYNFGNKACLQAFVRTWDELCQIHSRESVVVRSEDDALRKELMRKVTNNGYVEGATGIRVTGDGRLIRLVDAVVWNCYKDNGDYYGQAAFFDRNKLEDAGTL